MKSMRSIGIIGGGASGLMAAIAAARNRNAHVFLLEQNALVGKKILSTGNGRCNLTNEKMNAACYRSEDIEQVEAVLGSFGYEDTLRVFEQLGLCFRSKDGYIYPFSNQAAAVRDVLLMESRRLGVEIRTEVCVSGISMAGPPQCRPSQKIFRIATDKGEFFADKAILSAGGKAAAKPGAAGGGYAMAQSFGHSLAPVVPALVQLKVKSHPLAKAAGVRVDAKVTAFAGEEALSSDTGEVQITSYGISGIPVFQISRYAAKALYEKKPVRAELDLLPETAEEELKELLLKRKMRNEKMEAAEYLTGIFHSKLIPELLRLAGITPHVWMYKVTEEEIFRLAKVLKRTDLVIADTNGFANAQVCAGGVRLREIDERTMESRLQKGLYITGELLDADGMCGGYNLQWAWATGYMAGSFASGIAAAGAAKEALKQAKAQTMQQERA